MDKGGGRSRVTRDSFRFVYAPFVVYEIKNAMTLAYREHHIKSQRFHALVVTMATAPHLTSCQPDGKQRERGREGLFKCFFH